MRLLPRLRSSPAPARVAVALVIAILVGLLIQLVRAAPGPATAGADEVRRLLGYLGESAAPYLLVPFAAGSLTRTRAGAAALGTATCWLLVAAYYGWFVPGSMLAEHGGAAEQAFWLGASVVAGSLGGLLGRAAVRHRAVRWIMPAALLLEPVAWFVLLRLGVAPVLAQPADVAGAIVEAAVGLVWLAAVALGPIRPDRAARRRPRPLRSAAHSRVR